MEDKNRTIYEKMFGDDYHFIWSDNWCIEGKYIWFIAGAINILFCINQEEETLVLAERIPSDELVSLRLHPCCFKQEDSIFCLPDRGENIWRYYCKNQVWQRIMLKNPKKKQIRCSNAWSVKGNIYIVAIGLGQILELNIDTNCIENYYDLLEDGEGAIAGSTLVDDSIYVVGKYPARIYKFNCQSKMIQIYRLTDIQDNLETIGYDGEVFWLSGQKLKIYLWREEKGFFILDDFPESFGIYNFSGKYQKLLNYGDNKSEVPLFNAVAVTARYIWFIPFHANEILYIDKETLQIKKYDMENEEQTEEDMESQLLRHKYLLQYVKDNRYIGLFSLKNKWVCEIDCYDLSYKILNYVVNSDILHKLDKYILLDYYRQSKKHFENAEYGLESLMQYCLFEEDSDTVSGLREAQRSTVGQDIYSFLVEK